MSKYFMPSLLSRDTRKWSLVSLLFSLFYFLPVFFMVETIYSWQWACIFTAYVVFLVLYIWGVKSDSSSAFIPICSLIFLCFFVTYVTPGSNALFCFSTFLAGYYFSIQRAVLFLIITLFLEVVAFTWLADHGGVFLGIAAFLTVVLFVNAVFLRKDMQHRFVTERDQHHIQQLATIAERERISRDLHDLLGHSLSSIALKAELAEKLISSGKHEPAAIEIAAVADLTRSTLVKVRESVSGMKQKGLSAELKTLCQELQSAGFHTECEDRVSGHSSLNAEIESAIILLLKEACTNVLRHSRGNRARLELKAVHDAFLIAVWDNGEVSMIEAGNGIRGIEERCRSMGGQLTFQNDDGGTLLLMTLSGIQYDSNISR